MILLDSLFGMSSVELAFIAARIVIFLLLLFFRKRVANSVAEMLLSLTQRLKYVNQYPKKIKTIVKFSVSLIFLLVGFVVATFGWIPGSVEIAVRLGEAAIALAVYRILLFLSFLLEDYMLESSNSWDLEPQERKSFRTILPLGVGILRYIIHAGLIIFVVSLLGVDVSPFLNLGLVITGILGYALQPLIQDLVGLIRVLSENIYQEGDRVVFFLETEQEVTGTVKKISPLFTYLSAADGQEFIIQNRMIVCTQKFSDEPEQSKPFPEKTKNNVKS